MKTIDEMAEEAGAVSYSPPPMRAVRGVSFTFEQLDAFAELVRADEREACAKVCENGVDTEHPTVKGHIMKDFGQSTFLAKAIRARGNT